MNPLAEIGRRAGARPADLHLHTVFSIDVTKGHSFVEYMEAGDQLGVVPGFLDHFQAEKLGDPAYPFHADKIDRYFEAYDRARSTGLPSFLGLEVDYYDPRVHDDWNARTAAFLDDHGKDLDHVVGTVHDVFDGTITIPFELEALLRTHPFDAVSARYFKIATACVASGMFHGLAHPDVVYRFCGPGGLLPASDAHATDPRTVSCLLACADRGVAVEINLRGTDHPWGDTYPSSHALRILRAERPDATTFLGSDSHDVATFRRLAPRVRARAGAGPLA